MSRNGLKSSGRKNKTTETPAAEKTSKRHGTSAFPLWFRPLNYNAELKQALSPFWAYRVR